MGKHRILNEIFNAPTKIVNETLDREFYDVVIHLANGHTMTLKDVYDNRFFPDDMTYEFNTLSRDIVLSRQMVLGFEIIRR